VRNELEYRIPLRDAKYLLSLSNLKIEKSRSVVKLDNCRWLIDFYKGKNKGIVVAEVELPSENSKFEKPLWAGKEVTFDLRYRNFSLAKHPFTKWSWG
jgi:CYTH domain-containing protein